METTINQVFKNRVEKYGSRIAVEKRRNGLWERASWDEYYQRARNLGLGLHSQGIEKGDRIAILSDNRLEWVYTDMGSLGIGACVVALYATLPAHEIEYILKDSGAKAIVVENKVQLEKALTAQKNCPALEQIIVIESAGCDVDGRKVLAFDAVADAGQKKHQEDGGLFRRLSEAVTPDDLLTLQYTSGTTGNPKGSILTHGVIMAQLRALDSAQPKYADDTDHVVGFLPLSHIFERVPVHFYVMYRGITKSYAGSMDSLMEDIATKKPTIMFGVPRVHEKIYHKMLAGIREKSHAVQNLFAWAQSVGNEVSRYKQDKQPIPPALNFKYKLAYALVFKKLQHALGGRIRWFCAAGAPLDRSIVSFFNAAGLLVMECYVLSEVAGGATLSNLDDFYPGSVGRPLPGIEIKLAEDGEILIKGESLFKGYWGKEEETHLHFTEDGYFKTGDVGMFNKQGLLFITDRKKDLLITSGGKNIAPQKIEAIFKENPIFSQFVVVGDARKYLTALINIDLDIAQSFASEKGIKFSQPDDLLDDPAFLAALNEVFIANNQRLASVETIKYFRILKTPFSSATGELSVKLSVKRDVVQKKYADVINSMYKD